LIEIVNYRGLFTILAFRGLNKSYLVENKLLSGVTLAKLSKGEHISMKIIENICQHFKCKPNDILEFDLDD